MVVRGGGDLATGAVQKLWRAGLRVVVLETPHPTAIRRNVSLCEAVYEGTTTVEDMTGRLVSSVDEITACHAEGHIPLLIDPDCACLPQLKPSCLVDAILAKRNLGTTRQMAPCTIALGPGFTAGDDVDVVVETLRGHNLGRLIFAGAAAPNTGTPGVLGGQGVLRVLHAPANGVMRHVKKIGDVVKKGEPLFYVGDTFVTAPFTGLLRGLLRQGLCVHKGMKVADVDPRTDTDWRTISDKARCIGGGVLEACLYLHSRASAGAS